MTTHTRRLPAAATTAATPANAPNAHPPPSPIHTALQVGFDCRLCGEKQSIVRVYGSGAAKELRPVCQQLNAARAGFEDSGYQDDTGYQDDGGWHVPSSAPWGAAGEFDVGASHRV